MFIKRHALNLYTTINMKYGMSLYIFCLICDSSVVCNSMIFTFGHISTPVLPILYIIFYAYLSEI